MNSIHTLKDLISISECYEKIGDNHNAILNYEKALNLLKNKSKKMSEYTFDLLTKLSRLYHDTGEYSKAKQSCQESIQIAEVIFGTKDHPKCAISLNLLGIIYESLGEYDKAKIEYEKCLKIFRKKNRFDNTNIAKILNNIAGIHLRKKEYQDAEIKYKKAYSIDKSITGSNSTEIARDLNNLGILYKAKELYSKAEANYLSAISIYKKHEGINHPFVAMTLNNLGIIYEKTKSYKNAESVLTEALIIAELNKHPELIWHIQDSFRDLYSAQNKKEIAIFFGKKAIKTIQSIRSGIDNIDKKYKMTFVKSKSMAYRRLADLLVREGRFLEARDVLDLLKFEEYNEYMGVGITRGRKKISMTEGNIIWLNNSENRAERELDKICQPKNSINKANKHQRKDKNIRKTKKREFKKFIQNMRKYVKDTDNDSCYKLTAYNKKNKLLKNTLKELSNHNPILLHYFHVSNKLFIIITSPFFHSKGYEVDISKNELNITIDQFKKNIMKTKHDDYLIEARKLYNILFSKIEEDIKNAEIIMLSLDGSLRYIPMGVLYDGNQFLAEKYMLAIYSPSALASLSKKPKPTWTINGMGVTKKIQNYPELINVKIELDSIILDKRSIKEDNEGIFKGQIRLDNEFTLNALEETVFNIDSTNVIENLDPVLHIATHFKLARRSASESFLLLGDSTILSLKDIEEEEDYTFNLDLLTLSACDTGKIIGDGLEIDSLAICALRAGAKSVIASLWEVYDGSTALLMHEFYKIYASKKGITKIQAFHESQRKFIKGQIKAKLSDFNNKRGVKHKYMITNTEIIKEINSLNLSHPFFWAPFVLVGNWL